jgi:2-polyprenyl-3-methyl-5-hydroxy-6-metoxy-1,4-benzoquinol methylase
VAPDPETLKAYSLKVWLAKQGQLVGLMVEVGDRLGIFRQLAHQGAATAPEWASRLGLASRPLTEWLHGMAAAGLLDHSGGRFELPEAGAWVMAEEDRSLFFAAGIFGGSHPTAMVEAVSELMRTGRGSPYDDLGPETTLALERMTGPFNRAGLVPLVLSRVPGLIERLSEGIRVADVGCGAGVAAETVATTFPTCAVTGVDPSRHAIERAADRARGRANLRFLVGSAEDLEGQFELVLVFDCLHDMPRPDLVLTSILHRLAPGGLVLIKEIRSSGDFERDRKNPLLALAYGLSLVSCLASGLSTDDGLGLGNLGLHPAALTDLVLRCGFGVPERLDVPDPANLYYVVGRPVGE